MRRYTPAALAWVAAVTVLSTAMGASTAVAGAGSIHLHDWVALVMLAVCAAIAHIFPIRSASDGASYRMTNVFVLAGAIILPAPLLFLLAAMAISPETFLNRHRPGAAVRWAFNVSQAALAAFVANTWVGWTGGETLHELATLWDLGTLVGAAALFTLVQAFLVGVVIALQSRIPLLRTDTLSLPALMSDSLIAMQGMLVASLWLLRPSLLTLVPPVLLIVHRLTRNAHLAHLAEVDNKTGLYNSRYFERSLEEELSHSVRVKRPLSVLFADLDYFKRVNDQYGHAAGDQVLREMSTVLGACVRKGDIVARFGGEEFVVMLPGTDAEEAAFIGERIRSEVQKREFLLEDGRRLRCTVSIGIAAYPDNATDLSRLLEQADAAMYRAKQTRNAVARAHALPPVPRLEKTYQPVTSRAERAGLRVVPATQAAEPESGTALAAPTAVATPEAATAAVVSGSGAAPVAPAPAAAEAAPAAQTPKQKHPSPLARIAAAMTVPASPSVPMPVAHARLAPVLLWGVVLAGAMVATQSLLIVGMAGAWGLLIPFLLLTVAAEWLKVHVYEANRERISLSFTIAVTMAVMAVAPMAAALVSLTAAIVHVTTTRSRRQLGRTLFNLANPTLAAGAASHVYAAIHGWGGGRIDFWLLGAALVAVNVFYVVNVGIISLMISLYSGRPVVKVMRESAWFAPTNVVLGLTGAFLGGAHAQLGVLGFVMFVAPMLVLRFTLTLYARQSQRTIETLQSAKNEVEAAHEEKEDILRRLIETVALVIDARDNSVSGHSRRVARYAVAVGKELGLDSSELASLHTAGLFHDLGKVGIPESILHKPTRLTDEEYAVIKSHAAMGERILSEVPQLRSIARMVGEHHERYDGSGYPRGLKGKEISVGGRILVVVDSLETMLADRPYSKGRGLEHAMAELDRCSGTHFDPEVVAAVHRAVAAHGDEFFTDSADSYDREAIVVEEAPASVTPTWASAERVLAQVAA